MPRNRQAPRGTTIAIPLLAVAVLVIGAVIALRRGEGSGATTTSGGRPNIVMIMTDDQAVESMRVMTNVEELIGAEGVSFSDSVVSYPVCCPSRATFLTGQYMHNHGVIGNLPPHGGFGAFKQQDTTFPVALQRAGYDTVHIGKYLNGYRSESIDVPPGWSEWHGSLDPTTYRYFGFTLLEGGEERTYGGDEYQTDVYTELATSAIRRRADGDEPFFLNVSYLAPHAAAAEGPETGGDGPRPAVPAPRHAGSLDGEALPETAAFDEADVSDKPQALQDLPSITEDVRATITGNYARYLESLLAVDEGVERIVKALEETGQLKDTVVIYTSDNGFLFGQHRIPADKTWFYEPSIRVPLLMRGPGIPAGATRGTLVANIDLAPTILDLARATPLRTMDGRSLIPLLRNEQESEERGILLESEGAFYGLRTTRYAYIEHRTGERELYDLSTDPEQLDNRHGRPDVAVVEAELAARLAALRECDGTACHYP